MTDWVDDFTHDYFADSTYTLDGGTEGSSFTVGGGMLTVNAGGVGWLDERTAVEIGEVTLTVEDIAPLSTLQLGFTTTDFSEGAVGVFFGFSLHGHTDYVVGSSFGFDSAVFSPSGGLEIVLQLAADKVKLSIGAESVETAISPTDSAALSALSLFPFVSAASFADTGPVIFTRFTHTTGSAPPVPIAPGVRAGLQSSGLVPLHPLL